MGINGLLPIIKPICEAKHVQEFARSRVGVDVYGWLHRGIFSCASKLCRGIDTKAYVDYCMHRVRMLIQFHITPVLVFDGAELPMKAETHADRRARREDAYAKAEAAYASGDFRKAEEWYQRACPVTSEMARQVIRQCRLMNVEYVVAPYEADAQLAWMMASGVVDSIITEDSDLLVYGASRVFFKMTRDGHGDFFQSQNLPSLDSLSLNNFTEDMFMFMCVCAGCDFFKGVKGLGIRKAYPVVRRNRTLSRIIHAIRANSKYRVACTFAVDFTRACLVFRHQTVFDMQIRETVSLRKLDAHAIGTLPDGVLTKHDGKHDFAFLGRFLSAVIAQRLAEGHINPRTLKEYEDPLDIVERSISFVKPKFPAPQKSSPPNSGTAFEGFVVQPINLSRTQSSSRSVPEAVSHSAQKQYRTVPNLRARLSNRTMRTNSFNPRLEARRFAAESSSTAHKLQVATSSVWGKFKRSSVSNSLEAVPKTAALVPTTQCDTTKFCESTEAASSPEKPSDIYTSEKGVKGSTLKQPSQKVDLQDALSFPKRQRNISHTNRVDVVKRAVDKFAMKPVEKSLKFVPTDPPSPDRDSFRLFDEVDESSRDGCAGIIDSAAVSQINRLAPSSTPSVRHGLGRKISGKGNAKSSPQHMHQLRVSRFFTQKGQDDKLSRPKDYDPSEFDKTPQVVSPSGKVMAAMEGISMENKIAQKRKIDNFRRGAAGKKIRANTITETH